MGPWTRDFTIFPVISDVTMLRHIFQYKDLQEPSWEYFLKKCQQHSTLYLGSIVIGWNGAMNCNNYNQ